jgi:DNA-binding NarL/FixJ family response regulator
MRILIIEDNEAIAAEYLRFIQYALADVDGLTCTHITSIIDAFEPLAKEQWDVIIMDSRPGDPATYPPGNPENELFQANSGADLIRFRRFIEGSAEEIRASSILAVAANTPALRPSEELADYSMLKSEVEALIYQVREAAYNKA